MKTFLCILASLFSMPAFGQIGSVRIERVIDLPSVTEVHWFTPDPESVTMWINGIPTPVQVYTQSETQALIVASRSTATPSWSNITSKPTTIAGYGITDPIVLTSSSYANPAWITSIAYSKLTGSPTDLASFTNGPGFITSSALTPYATTASLSSYATTASLSSYTTTSSLTSGLAGKEPSITAGTNLQYWRGDKTWQTLPIIPTTLSSFTNDVPFATSSALTSGLAGKLSNITGLITAGSGVSISGSGTSGSPYSIASTASGTVTSVTAGTGLSGGTFTTSGTISLPNVGTAGTYSLVTTDAQGRVSSGVNWGFSTPGTVSRSIVATAAAANGWKISDTRNSTVRYSVTINTTVSLSGNSTGYVVLEIAATNSTTASDWSETARVPSGQSGTLVVGLTLNQIGGGELEVDLPAGWYARLRSVNTAGTPTYAFNSGQEVLK